MIAKLVIGKIAATAAEKRAISAKTTGTLLEKGTSVPVTGSF
jgi:hypothetical protein